MECLRHAVAFGTAACLTEGTNPPRKEDVDGVLPDVAVQEVSLDL
jgi:1-phosphofructokinase